MVCELIVFVKERYLCNWQNELPRRKIIKRQKQLVISILKQQVCYVCFK